MDDSSDFHGGFQAPDDAHRPSFVDRLRRRWQEFSGEEDMPVDADTPAWAVSLLIHVMVLLTLALVGLAKLPRPESIVTITTPMSEEVLTIPQEVVVSNESEEPAGAESEQSDALANDLAPTLAELSVVPVDVNEDVVADVALEPLDVEAVASAIDEQVVVKGQGGEAMTGSSGAVDRLTMEIKNGLERGPMVVCWVFDQSVSLAGQRMAIAGRLDRVFAELGEIGAARRNLLNVVIGYGNKVNLVTARPTEEVADVVNAIRSIPIDDTGAEMTFHAVQKAVESTKLFRTSSPRRNVMIVVFTDEVGNDQEKLDETCELCRRFSMPVYVVGVPAPFGMREVTFKFVDPDPKFSQEAQWAQIEQGPESFYPEVVRLQGGKYADEAIDSGFGPYALSRLCGETGGIYFAVHANRDVAGRVSDAQVAPMSSRLRHFFDPQVMRAYAPTYLAVAKLDQKIASNKAVASLIRAAKEAAIGPMANPQMSFPKKNEGEFVNLLSDAQKVAAVIEPKINTIYSILEQGAKDRDKVKEKRWQAGYDLAMGRILAMKVRTETYNAMLAEAKTGKKFANKNSDTWALEPSDEISVGSQLQKLGGQARMYLDRVVKEHPGTPWALIAADELRTPLGYRWIESHTGVNNEQAAGNGGNTVRADDKKKMLAPPKPRRDLKKL